MIYQKLRRNGNSYVVTVPRDEVNRLKLVEGQMLAVSLQPVNVEYRPRLDPETQKLLDEELEGSEAALRYLATH